MVSIYYYINKLKIIFLDTEEKKNEFFKSNILKNQKVNGINSQNNQLMMNISK